MVFVQDTYTGTDGTALTAHTGEVGASWSVQPGSSGLDFTLTGINRARIASVANSFGQLLASGVPPSPDYVVRATLTPLSIIAGESIQIQGRSSSAESTMYTAAWFSSDTLWHLFRVVAGVFTEIGPNAASPAPSVNVPQALELRMRGSNISFFIDGALVIAGIDTVITAAGFAGIGGAAGGTGTQSSTTGFQWSDFIAETLSRRSFNALRPRIFAPGLGR